jgi:hypothetical protein
VDEVRPGAATPRLRWRLSGVALAVAVLGGSGALLDRSLGPREPASSRATGPLTGSWYCPHGGGAGWKAWVVIANPGPEAVTVETTTFGESGPKASSAFAVAATSQVYREVPAEEAGAATQVEYFGGWVGAGTVIRSRGPDPGTAATRCAAAPRSSWFLPDALTGRGQTAVLVVMNPFAETAQFDVSIRTEKRPISPGLLTPFVIEPGTSVGLRLNRYALQGPGERTVGVRVTVRTGRVVAAGVGVSPEGLRAELGASPLLLRIALPAGGYEGTASLALSNPGTTRSQLVLISQAGSGQRVVSGAEGLSVAAGGVRTVQLEDFGGAAAVDSTNDRPLAAVLRLAGTSGDLATIGGGAPAPRWLVLPTLPPDGGQALLVLQNPGRKTADVSIRFIAPTGPVAAPGVAHRIIQPGRAFRLDLSKALGDQPISVVVVATGGSIVAGSSSYPADGSGYASTLGLPIPLVAGDVG